MVPQNVQIWTLLEMSYIFPVFGLSVDYCIKEGNQTYFILLGPKQEKIGQILDVLKIMQI